MSNTNIPRLNDVPNAFRSMSDRGVFAEISIDKKWTDIYGFTKHVQAIAPIPNLGNSFMFTASVGDNKEGALFVADNYQTIQRFNGSFTQIEYYIEDKEIPTMGDHPGGLQIYGDWVIIPYEYAGKTTSLIVIYKIIDGDPKNLKIYEIIYNSISKAGAAGLTQVNDKWIVAIRDGGDLLFWESIHPPGYSKDPSHSCFNFLCKWSNSQATNKKDWHDGGFPTDKGGYESITLLTDTEDNLWLIGYSSGDGLAYIDYIDVWNVDPQKAVTDVSNMMTKSLAKHMKLDSKSDFGVHMRWGANLYVNSDGNINFVVGSRGKSGGDDISTKLWINQIPKPFPQ